MVEDLYIEIQYRGTVWKNDAIENTLWLQFFLPFTAVNNLYLFVEFAPGIVATLQELVESRITEVLPLLQNIFVERFKPPEPFQENDRRFKAQGPFRENVGRLVAARRLSGHHL